LDIQIRPIAESEWEAFVRTANNAFGEFAADEDYAAERHGFDFTRSYAAFDGDHMVGTANDWGFELTLPGLATVPVAAVSWVGVLPTHRRRGVLTTMMNCQLDDVAARGETIAVLTASEATIYGRFGYGASTRLLGWELPQRYATLRTAASEERGRIRLVPVEEARTLFPDVYDRVWRRVPGEVSRDAGWWERIFTDVPGHREGWSARFYVVHESDGQVDGFVHYRIKENWGDDNIASNTLRVSEVRADTEEAAWALWRFVFGIDLVGSVVGWAASIDDPVRLALVDPRRMRINTVNDHLWVRLVDIAAALAARRYATADELTIGVRDPFRPANSGSYHLRVDAEGVAECERTSGPADLELDVAALGAAYLGDTPFVALATAGLVTSTTPDAIARADRLFRVTPAPYCNTGF